MAVGRGMFFALLCCFAVCALLYLIGFGAPNWFDAGSLKYGLWQFCINDVCRENTKTTDTMKATQAMMILGLLSVIGAGVAFFLWTVAILKSIPTTEGIYGMGKKLSGILTIIAGVFGLIGVMVYGIRYLELTEEAPEGFAYWLSVVASVGFVVVGSVTLVMSRA